MDYKFAANRKVSFIVEADGQNWLVQFDDPNQSGVSAFITTNAKIAHAVRRHAFSRRGIIKETTEEPVKPVADTEGVVAEKPAEKPAAKPAAEADEREFDNYTVARETLCKEFDVNKSTIRNPEALAKLAAEHGIVIKYKEL